MVMGDLKVIFQPCHVVLVGKDAQRLQGTLCDAAQQEEARDWLPSIAYRWAVAVAQGPTSHMAHLQWESLQRATMHWADGEKEKNSLSIMKTDGTGELRVERNSPLGVFPTT